MAMEKLRTELEAQHQASVNLMKSLLCKEKETEVQLQVKAQVALAKAAWKQELLKVGIFLPLLISLKFLLVCEDFFCSCTDGEDLGTKAEGGEESRPPRDV